MRHSWVLPAVFAATACGAVPLPSGPATPTGRAPALHTDRAPLPTSLPQRVGDRMVVEPITQSRTTEDVMELLLVADDLGVLDPVWSALDDLSIWLGLGPVPSVHPPVTFEPIRVMSIPRWSWILGADASVLIHGRGLCGPRMTWVRNVVPWSPDACVYPPAILVLPAHPPLDEREREPESPSAVSDSSASRPPTDVSAASVPSPLIVPSPCPSRFRAS